VPAELGRGARKGNSGQARFIATLTCWCTSVAARGPGLTRKKATPSGRLSRSAGPMFRHACAMSLEERSP
jgi:hypothetical protein